LKDDEGRAYRVWVFRLLAITGRLYSRTGHRQFRLHREAQLFLREHPADTKALSIMDELDQIYSMPRAEIDELRGAVVEVFSYMVCRKFYNNAGIEVKVIIKTWESDSIDTAGCNTGKGHCLQSKSSMANLRSIIHQKSDFNQIEKLTNGRAQGFFVTPVDRGAFFQSLNAHGLNPAEYEGRVFDRRDLFVLEERIRQ
jgi:hypothetical protein